MIMMRMHVVIMLLCAVDLYSFPGITMSFKDKGLGLGNAGAGLGDRLMIYIKAKRASYELKVPLFLHWPFVRYQDFKFVDNEQKLDAVKDGQSFKKLSNAIFEERLQENTIYIVGQRFTFEPWQSRFPLPFDELYNFCIQDESFLKMLRKYIRPRSAIKKLEVPANALSVALHIRYGKEAAFLEEQNKRPLKFPPLSYYTDQIKLLARKFSQQKIYIHLFTDYYAPEHLVAYFQKEVDNSMIEFAYSKKGAGSSLYADLFNMMDFDCLIRPSSSFSRVAQLLGNHKVIVYPLHSVREESGIKIDKVIVLERAKKNLRFQEVSS